MDKEAQISSRGFNFFREAVLVKEATSVMTIKLCNKDIPYEAISRVGSDRIAQYIGKDVAKEFDAGPANAKAVLETLPADLQTLLVNLTKNV
jgi:ACT domain-containing protein